MAQKKLTQLTSLPIPSTGDVTYIVNSQQPFQANIDRIAATMINEYGILTTRLPSNFMTSGNAEIILNGLNNAYVSRLDSERININLDNFVSGYFDVDGGTFYDTYSNSSTFDGGGL